jgi:diadenosine tetraphosphatase ApaH/serine/threonine PP2A family protein phosphatase
MQPSSEPAAAVSVPRVPPGRRVYVVGDIHGRHDLLVVLHRLIAEDAATAGSATQALVYLGDYIDRGPGSSAVIDRLLGDPLPGFETVFLKGNHEDMLLGFLDGPSDANWLLNGGAATLASYGIEPGQRWFATHELDTLRQRLVAALPAAHARFLRSLRLTHVEGDYFFVHAGVQPERPLDDQDAHDLLWIRGAFLERTGDLEKCVVHGHTIQLTPDIAPNRIGIDTGAFFTGRLTCLVLEGSGRRFLTT